MAIGSDTIFTDDYTRADHASSLGADYTVQCSSGVAVAYGITSNRAQLKSGSAGGQYSWGKIDSAQFGGANYRVRIGIQETGSGNNIGAMLRLSTSGSTPTGYFLGKNGAGAVIRRYDAGVITNLVDFQYIPAWDGATGLFHLQLDVDISGSDVVLTVASAASEGGTYTTRATYTDTSGSKILTAGTAAIATAGEYNGANLKTWDYFRVIGTAAASESPPVITDVDSDEAFASNATGVTITGTDLGATTDDRTVELVQGATEVAQTQTAGDATSGAFTVVGWSAGGLLSYGVSTDLKVTTSEGDDSLAVTVNPPSGFAYVDIVTPDTEADYRIEGDPVDIEADDQIEYATTTSSGSTVEIDDAGVVTETGGDHTADALSFTPVTGAELGAVSASAAETITGVDATFAFRIQDGTGWGTSGTVTIAYTPAIAIVGGEYRINGGSWTSAPGTVAEGDDLEVRGAASDFYDTETFVTVSIDSDEYQFSITTRAADTTPEAFSFVDQTGVGLSTVRTSAAITVDGIEAPAAISVSGGTYSINGGAFTSDAGVVSDGDSVRVRHTAAAAYETQTDTILDIGGVTDTFSSTTSEEPAPGSGVICVRWWKRRGRR
jgi:hypothetical protein